MTIEEGTKPQLRVVSEAGPRPVRTPRPEAEALLLGAFLDASGQLLGANAGDLLASSGLVPSDFLDPRVRAAMVAIDALSRHARAVSAQTVFVAARNVGELRDDALPWLQGLQANNSLDRKQFDTSAELYRQAARGLSVARQLRGMAQELESHSRRPWQVVDALETLAKQLDIQWAPSGMGSDNLLEVFSEWERVGQGGGKPIVLPSGLKALDAVMGGGWVANLNLVIGPPSIGKSALLGSAMLSQIGLGYRIGIFGLEDGVTWLTRRLIAAEMDVPVGEVAAAQMTDAQKNAAADVAERWGPLLQNLVTFAREGLSVGELTRRAEDWVRSKGVQCIYVDHVGEIEHQWRKGENESNSIGRTYTALRGVARRHGVPMVVVAHTVRPEQDKSVRPPRIDEINGSAWAERRARKIVGLWEKKGELRATVLKNTEGERDITVALVRRRRFALVEPDAGELIDLEAERKQEKAARDAEAEAARAKKREATEKDREAKAAKKAAEKAAKDAAKAAEKAAKAKKEEPQRSLLPQVVP